MKQIDQEPGDYRVQRPDGSWTQRVDKGLCRWLSILSGSFALMAALAPGEKSALAIAVMAFLSGGLFTLSLKSIDW